MTDALYYQLETTLESSGSSIYPAEAQGALCGMLCLTEHLDLNSWMAFILDQSQSDTQASYRSSLDADLAEVQEMTEVGFNPESGGITLLLPSDDTPLQERLEALSTWCEGFLYGVGISNGADGLNNAKKIPENAEEFMTDVREIGRLDTESDDENAEHYYMELVEYIRVGVLVFREEMLPSPSAIAGTPSIPDNETHH